MFLVRTKLMALFSSDLDRCTTSSFMIAREIAGEKVDAWKTSVGKVALSRQDGIEIDLGVKLGSVLNPKFHNSQDSYLHKA